ncbi:MAG: sec-independent protein translocase protein TatB [Candidatus Azotimanducaceae bacterium]|jgi:sec-independent protein translocase protein TatB
MFDIGFPELMLISIVALLVIGPERLPETIRSIMLWLGRIRRAFTNIKNELEQEIGVDEIRRQLHNETIMKDIKESKEKISDALKEADQSIDEFKHSINESIDTTKIDTAKIDVTKPSQASEGEIDEPQPASTNGSTVLKTVQNTNDDKTKQ